jgi:hypothetical protein
LSPDINSDLMSQCHKKYTDTHDNCLGLTIHCKILAYSQGLQLYYILACSVFVTTGMVGRNRGTVGRNSGTVRRDGWEKQRDGWEKQFCSAVNGGDLFKQV